MNKVMYENVVLKNLTLKADGKIVTGRLNDYKVNDDGREVTTHTTAIVITDEAVISLIRPFIGNNDSFKVISALGEENTRFDKRPGIENSQRRAPWSQVIIKDVVLA